MTPLALAVLLNTTAAPVPKAFADPLPDGALVRLGSARFRGFNTDGVTFSKDGKTLYATDDKNTVYRWDAETGKPLKPITFEVKAPTFSRVRGDRAFVVEHAIPGGPAHNSVVHVFDVPSGNSRGKFDPKEYLRFTQSGPGLHRVDISADGRRLAVQSHSTQSVKVFDVSGDEPTEILSTKHPQSDRVLLSPDGRRVLSVGEAGSTVIDLKTGETVCTIAGEVPNAAFSPDGSKLIGYSYTVKKNGNMTTKMAGSLTVWDATTAAELSAPDITGYVWQSIFHTADVLFVGRNAKDGPVVARWNLKTGKEEWSAAVPFVVPTYDKSGGYFNGHGGTLPTLVVSPDGKRMAVADRFGRLALFDGETGKRADNDPASHPAEVQWASLSADGKAATTVSNHDIREWDARTGELKSMVAPPELAGGSFVGAAGELLVWIIRGTEPAKWELAAWDRAKGKWAWRTTAGVPSRTIRTVGEGVVIHAYGGTGLDHVHFIDQAGKRQERWGLSPNAAPLGLSADTLFHYGEWKPGGVQLTVVGRSLKTGEKTLTCQCPYDPDKFNGVNLIDPSADGKFLGLGTYTGAWMVVETGTGRVLSSGTAPTELANNYRHVSAMPISTDGDKVVIRMMHSPVAHAFELKEKGKTWTLDGKGAAASAVAFSPDGKRAIVGYRDGTAIIWDVSK